MPKNEPSTKSTWIDPDEAPEWTTETFDRAAVHQGETLIRPGSGTLTKRGRPKSDDPKLQVTLRLDREVVDHFRESGPGWQSRINEALRLWAKV
jgi:uncharacterized protein (DUF4415 family)